jgi:hypothetical protein
VHSQKGIKLEVEKIYKIDVAGNTDIERVWILTNETSQNIDMNDLSVYVVEIVNALSEINATDSEGRLESRQKQEGSGIKVEVKPRINNLGPFQKYQITLKYYLPSFVHKLGEAWFFADSISGMAKPSFENPVSNKMDIKLKLILPKLKKSFWQTIYHESHPLTYVLPKEQKNLLHPSNTILECKSSLFPQDNFEIKLVYGIRTRTRLTSFLSVVGSATVTGLITYFFSQLKGG